MTHSVSVIEMLYTELEDLMCKYSETEQKQHKKLEKKTKEYKAHIDKLKEMFSDKLQT